MIREKLSKVDMISLRIPLEMLDPFIATNPHELFPSRVPLKYIISYNKSVEILRHRQRKRKGSYL